MEKYIMEQPEGWGDIMLSLLLTQRLIEIDNEVENQICKEE